MRPDGLDGLLRRTYGQRQPNPTEHKRGLQNELLARHRQLYPRKKRWKIMTSRTWFRPALAGLMVVALGIVSCTAPTEYNVDVGKKLSITFDTAAKTGGDLEAQIESVVSYVDALPDVEKVAVSINEQLGGPLTAGILVWGQNLDGSALEADLLAQFPVLSQAEITIEALEGTVEGNLAEAFGHAVFNFEVSGETAEEIRLQILQQLAEQGIDGQATVNVQMQDGQQTIDIELNDIDCEGAGADPDCQMIIELKDAPDDQ